MTWKTGNEDCLLHVTRRVGDSLEGITITTRMNGEKTTITAATGTLSPGSAGDPADVNSVKLTIFNAQSQSTTKKAPLMSMMLVLHYPTAVATPGSKKTDLNAPTFAILGIGSLALLLTTRWFTVRVLHWPQTVRYRITAILPLLMGLILMGLLPALQTKGYKVDYAALICCAFGLAFSLGNILTPSRYSRILGAIFLLIYGYLLFAFTLGMIAGGI